MCRGHLQNRLEGDGRRLFLLGYRLDRHQLHARINLARMFWIEGTRSDRARSRGRQIWLRRSRGRRARSLFRREPHEHQNGCQHDLPLPRVESEDADRSRQDRLTLRQKPKDLHDEPSKKLCPSVLASRWWSEEQLTGTECL